jgi:glycosyltransferase involved in cell wall biosynthesis
MPRVSIIIPTYNSAQFIAQAVDSVLAQTYPDFEVIVVDDGSTDDTQSVLAPYSQRIRYIHQANKGPSAARNKGILAAWGDYILFLDSDDLIPPNKLELQIPPLEAHPDSGLVYSAWQHINENGTRIWGEMRPNKQGRVLKDLLRRSFYFPPGAAVIRRDCLAKVGTFDETIKGTEDTDMWLRIARAGYAFEYFDQPLFLYRVVKGSLSSNVTSQAQNEFAVLDKFFVDPDLPKDIRALKDEAYSMLHYEFGAKHYHSGDVELGRDHIRQASAICPSLSENKEWLLEWLAGYALGPTVEDPHRLLDLIFDNLPLEATTLRSLRRRAHARYHIAAAFSAYRNHRLKDVRQHVLPALIGDPFIIRNRGFVRIAAQSLLG